MANHYFVEGAYYPKARKGKSSRGSLPEPFARSYWADNPAQALQLANEDIHGGQWTAPPRVGTQSEAQQMRAQGQPELPGFSSPARRKK